MPVRNLILALGHSARDTVERLYGQGLFMEAKPFAVGDYIDADGTAAHNFACVTWNVPTYERITALIHISGSYYRDAHIIHPLFLTTALYEKTNIPRKEYYCNYTINTMNFNILM